MAPDNSPADRRLAELIDKWLTSIELHLQYAELSDAAYARVQTWPKHERPSRWVLEVARQKILELKTHCENRRAMGDSKFAEALELMAFLANLVGVQHIQRFIPLADPSAATTAPTVEAPTIAQPIPPRAAPTGEEPTREMPRLKPQPRAVASASVPSRAPAPSKKAQPVASPAKPSAPASEAIPSSRSADVQAKIVADAIRLLKWGKAWHELAELIERIADRPSAAEIRKVLRAHKAEIEKKAAG